MPNSPASAAAPLLQLSLPNDKSALETARLALLEFLDPHDLSARVIFRLELVLEETLMNRLWHAYPEGGRHSIDMTAQVLPDVVTLSFADDGIAFDPLQQPTHDRPTRLEDAVPGGLGLLLTRKTVSLAEYERVDGRNLVTLHVSRDA